MARTETSKTESKLTPKQRLFIEAYLASFNATRAAITAGYSEASAYSQGCRLLKNAEIAAAVSARLSEAAMPADEVLARLADHARGDMGDFLSIKGSAAFFDLAKAEKTGKLHLLKRYALSKGKGMEIELHDAQAALGILARHHGLLKDRIQHEGEGLDLLRQFLTAGTEGADGE